jgi:hypothetical protein
MPTKKRESKLSKLIQKNCNQIHFTRIESSTMNGIPDLNGCINGYGFWMELKSDKVKYPKLSKWQISWINKHINYGGVVLICNHSLLERAYKLYRPVSVFTDPRLLKPRFSFSDPVHWPSFQDAIRELLMQRSSRCRSLINSSRFSDTVRDSVGSVTELDLARVS